MTKQEHPRYFLELTAIELDDVIRSLFRYKERAEKKLDQPRYQGKNVSDLDLSMTISHIERLQDLINNVIVQCKPQRERYIDDFIDQYNKRADLEEQDNGEGCGYEY